MKLNGFLVLLALVSASSLAQDLGHGSHQPYSSYWFVEDLLAWSAETDKDAKYNMSQIPLADRFLKHDKKKLENEPGIVSLIAPHTTSNYPSQGFQSVKQYSFPYWQYIDYFVQWGGAANEGIIVPPNATWTDVAHKNGVKSIGTVFFPPNVYGGKEMWVYEFLKQNKDGSFPVADKLIEVANTYHFDGWFINQETYNLKSDAAERMIAFIQYYRKNSKLKLVWYDAMIEDGRVIWQDELNNHNQVFFQNDNLKMSDLFFINFRYAATNLEDSKLLANALGRSEWELYAGIDVQSKSYKTLVQWDILFDSLQPKNTSIGLYWPNSTFDISTTKEPEEVYANEQKFWTGGTKIETRFGESTWKGFANYFVPRSVINKLPFKTNFNYGLGRFYNEKGKSVSNEEWHNLSIQDILPTWQGNTDSTKVKTTFSFKESYEGGSSFMVESFNDTKVPLYKTNIALNKKVNVSVVTKTDATIQLRFYGSLSDGTDFNFPVNASKDWKKTSFKISKKKNVSIIELGIQTIGNGEAYLGEISLYEKKEKLLPPAEFTTEVFPKDNHAEIFIHFDDTAKATFYNIYAITDTTKHWLGKTPSKDYYIPNVPISKNDFIQILVEPIAADGTKGESSFKKIQVKR